MSLILFILVFFLSIIKDNDGAYYWHIKSGTIQREPPIWPKDKPVELKTPVSSTNPQQFLTTSKSQHNTSFNHFYGAKENLGLGNKIQVSSFFF